MSCSTLNTLEASDKLYRFQMMTVILILIFNGFQNFEKLNETKILKILTKQKF